ncbi:Na(+)/H(+) antiporter NhaP [Porphyridium purpureum]|uniref:Na(+)/H(+) antiporter NhaP n=1 Tax=Porphyridium purpureum TaxID=35688 RepID=A0A5J4YMK7_PORPP|nr:Na(+)/H(+) antiporter NhaP [Porphyridium purpureum]|eukprot:POR2281..scf244_11
MTTQRKETRAIARNIEEEGRARFGVRREATFSLRHRHRCTLATLPRSNWDIMAMDAEEMASFMPTSMTSVGIIFCVIFNILVFVRWLNTRYLKLPGPVIVSLASMLAATIAYIVVVLGKGLAARTAAGAGSEAENLLTAPDHNLLLGTFRTIHTGFSFMVLRWMLGLVIFADASETIIHDFYSVRTPICVLATFTTFLNAIIIMILTYSLTYFFLPVSWTSCFLFGALISPTDPLSVLGVIRTPEARERVPRSVSGMIAGEALFNDVVGVVLFELGCVIVERQHSAEAINSVHPLAMSVVKTCSLQLGLGVVIGTTMAYFIYLVLAQRSGSPTLDVSLTIVAVINVNAACTLFGGSIPLANVIAGLLIGNHGKMFAMSKKTAVCFHWIWRFIGDTINAFMYVAIGFESYNWLVLWQAFGIRGLVPVFALVLFSVPARFLAIRTSLWVFAYTDGTLLLMNEDACVQGLMAWSGIRGAISIAMVLALPEVVARSDRGVLFLLTYSVVLFGLSVQGLTFPLLLERMDLSRYESLVDPCEEQSMLPLPSPTELLRTLSTPSVSFSDSETNPLLGESTWSGASEYTEACRQNRWSRLVCPTVPAEHAGETSSTSAKTKNRPKKFGTGGRRNGRPCSDTINSVNLFGGGSELGSPLVSQWYCSDDQLSGCDEEQVLQNENNDPNSGAIKKRLAGAMRDVSSSTIGQTPPSHLTPVMNADVGDMESPLMKLLGTGHRGPKTSSCSDHSKRPTGAIAVPLFPDLTSEDLEIMESPDAAKAHSANILVLGACGPTFTVLQLVPTAIPINCNSSTRYISSPLESVLVRTCFYRQGTGQSMSLIHTCACQSRNDRLVGPRHNRAVVLKPSRVQVNTIESPSVRLRVRLHFKPYSPRCTLKITPMPLNPNTSEELCKGPLPKKTSKSR